MDSLISLATKRAENGLRASWEREPTRRNDVNKKSIKSEYSKRLFYQLLFIYEYVDHVDYENIQMNESETKSVVNVKISVVLYHYNFCPISYERGQNESQTGQYVNVLY